MRERAAQLVSLLERQDGLVATSQLRELSFAPTTVTSRIQRGTWTWVLPRVAGVAGVPLTWERRARAVLLSLGESSWLSHRSAAHLHGLRGVTAPQPIEATVPYGRSVRIGSIAWARVHRSRGPFSVDAARPRAGLRATSVERTLLDLATTGTVGWSMDTVADALRRNLTSLERLRAVTESRAHVVGRARLRRTLAFLDPDLQRARSIPEWEIRQMIVAVGLPPPVLNHEIFADDGSRFEIDLAWPEFQLGYEYDSDEFHSTPREIRRDRLRHRRIQQLGWDLRHLSSNDRRQPQRLVAEVRDALLLNGWRDGATTTAM